MQHNVDRSDPINCTSKRPSPHHSHQLQNHQSQQGIDLLGNDAVDRILHLVKRFDDFSKRNDPFGEHDFGAIEYEGNTVFWKIDYYDLDLMNHSPDPSDPHVTRRVLTIMLGEEY